MNSQKNLNLRSRKKPAILSFDKKNELIKVVNAVIANKPEYKTIKEAAADLTTMLNVEVSPKTLSALNRTKHIDLTKLVARAPTVRRPKRDITNPAADDLPAIVAKLVMDVQALQAQVSQMSQTQFRVLTQS